MRVVPFENEAVNECWISDRDRFSYEGLNAPDRLSQPMLKQDGTWREVDWPTALELCAHALSHVRECQGRAVRSARSAPPQSTVEELHLLGR
jgi:NADH-quinone oxidoreductase subunit G